MCKLSSWPKHILSHARKLELVKIVLQGIKRFWLLILPIPSVVIDKLYERCWLFIWISKHPSISWATICLAKEEDEYGVWDLQVWNVALLSQAL